MSQPVVIADDHPIFRMGLRAAIQEGHVFTVVGEAEDGPEALDVMRAHPDAIAVLDLAMPGLDGFEVLTQSRGWPKPPPVVILTMHDDCAERAFELGAMGYLLKDHTSTEVVTCLHAVARGRRYVSEGVGLTLDKLGHVATTDPLDALTATERRVVKLIGTLKTSRQIAELMCVSLRTVQNHRHNACKKLGLRGNQALLRFALEHPSRPES